MRYINYFKTFKEGFSKERLDKLISKGETYIRSSNRNSIYEIINLVDKYNYIYDDDLQKIVDEFDIR